MIKPPKIIKVHLGLDGDWVRCRSPKMCANHTRMIGKLFDYIFLSEHEKEKAELSKGIISYWKDEREDYRKKLAEKDKIIEGLLKRLPMPLNVNITHGFAEKLLNEKKQVKKT